MTVLVVEDDKDTRDMLAVGLSLQGYDVRVAACRYCAMRMLSGVHAILLDYSMPGLPIRDFLHLVRSHHKSTCIILISAIEDIEKRARELGLQFYIAKPFDFETIEDVMNQCVQTASTQ